MNFRVVRTMEPRTLHVVADTDGVYTVVAELLWRFNNWNLFHVESDFGLTYTQRDEMNVFANKQIVLMNITERLTK